MILPRDVNDSDSAPTTDKERRGRERIATLRKIAASDPFREIDDVLAWQREIRRDRPLPGREE